MKNVDRVLILGAGVGGLGAAALFAQHGADVTVLETKASAEALGVGINQPANSLRILRDIGVLDDLLPGGFTYDGMVFHDHHGEVVVATTSALGGDVPANLGLSRSALARSLAGAAERAGARIRYGTHAVDFQQDGETVLVTLVDGTRETYDLVVAFDGIKSATRQHLFGPNFDPQFTGFSVWRVTLPRPESVDRCQLFHGVQTKAGMIPLSPTHMYLFVVTEEAGNPHFDPANYRSLLLDRLSEYTGIVKDMKEAIDDTCEIIYSPLSEVRVPAPWHVGRIVLGGDAVHACAPHLTQGAAMALEDASVLVGLIDSDLTLDDALTAYAARRLPRVTLVADVSRGILQAEMSVTPDTHASSLDGLRKHLPERLAGVEAMLNQPA